MNRLKKRILPGVLGRFYGMLWRTSPGLKYSFWQQPPYGKTGCGGLPRAGLPLSSPHTEAGRTCLMTGKVPCTLLVPCCPGTRIGSPDCPSDESITP